MSIIGSTPRDMITGNHSNRSAQQSDPSLRGGARMNDDHLAERRAGQLSAARGEEAFNATATVQNMDLREGKVARVEYVGQ